ncbi:DNA polymerase [Listeria monocytogenes]|uniref:DNA polymerase n=1 Tax=Listeria monocytogenes TaxID=1639 RepID=UPI000A8800E7|nr:DNA polymerase [Listeria monocytogenes]
MSSIKTLNIDIETYSDVELAKAGVYKYASSPAFEILLFAYSIDNGEKKCIDLSLFDIPEDVLQALTNKNVIKKAWNAQFERVCLSKYLGVQLDPSEWRCTMVLAMTLGLPASLGQCAKFLGINQQKDSAGTMLINYFSKPCKPAKTNDNRTRNLPEHSPERWAKFIDYCIQDVEVESTIDNSLLHFEMKEWDLYSLDQRINDRGVFMDGELIEVATSLMDKATEDTKEELKRLTGVANPNSRAQILDWMALNGVITSKLDKDAVSELMKDAETPENVKKMLFIRSRLSNSSTKKYYTMQKAVCPDGRIKGVAQFYGASRTGRWAGRLIQTQNLPQNHLADLDIARSLVKAKDVEAIEMIYDSLEDTLKQLIRTAIIAEPGNTLLVSDFSAIEARVLSWLADERWRLDVFETHGKIYEASASKMFNVPLEDVTKGSDLRASGKVTELAAGYQGSVGAMKQMDKAGKVRPDLSPEAVKKFQENYINDITEEAAIEAMIDANYKRFVDAWREANPGIVAFWYGVERAAIEAVEKKTSVNFKHGIQFNYQPGFLFVRLPSGRSLAYARPSIEEGGRFNKKSLVYYGKDENKAAFVKTATYGGKLVENITQAIARDLLAEKMKRLDDEGHKIVFHVHDEVVIETEKATADIEVINKIMAEPISWAPGLPLDADGYQTNYYKKD